MSFDALVADLEALQKAQTLGAAGDDQRIAAAADEPDDDDAKAGKKGESEDDEDEEEMMGKSFAMTLEDGTVIEAVDGSALVKALQDENRALSGKFAEQEEALAKTLTVVVETIKGQADLIKSLQETVSKLSGEGRGRKAVLTVVEKSNAGQPAPKKTAMTRGEFMAKAESAFNAGRISGRDLSIAEGRLNEGAEVPAHIIEQVIATQGA